jgi:hypothetical protein
VRPYRHGRTRAADGETFVFQYLKGLLDSRVGHLEPILELLGRREVGAGLEVSRHDFVAEIGRDTFVKGASVVGVQFRFGHVSQILGSSS